MAEKTKTAEQVYDSNVKKVKFLRFITPIVFWGCIAIAVICFILAIRGTFGNLGEMISLLDNNKYTGEQLEQNYNYLIKKYGEWTIGSGGAGFTIKFIDIKQVAFSGFVIFTFIMAIFFLLTAFVLGKWILPKLADQVERDNQDMVNRTILKQSEKE